jgi:hypothetical protein
MDVRAQAPGQSIVHLRNSRNVETKLKSEF